MAKAKKAAKRPAEKPKKTKPSASAAATRKAKAEPAAKKRAATVVPPPTKVSKTITLPKKVSAPAVMKPVEAPAASSAKIIRPAPVVPPAPVARLVKPNAAAASKPDRDEVETPSAPRAPEPPPKPDPKFIDKMLRTAISDKRLVRLTYNKVSRIVEPHDYGVRKGISMLLAYQPRLAGAHVAPEAVEGWRWFNLDKITELAVLKDNFAGSRGAEHSQHSTWDTVHARVG